LVLFERTVQHLLRLRDPALPDVPLSLTAFRDAVTPLAADDANRTATTPLLVTSDTLRSLQGYLSGGDPGWRLHELFSTIDGLVKNSSNSKIVGLRKLTNTIYRLAATETAAHPGLYPSPFDTLRGVVSSLPADVLGIDGIIPLPGDPPSGSPDPATSYSGNHGLTAGQITDADGAFAFILSKISTRATTTYTATITADSFTDAIPSAADTGSAGTLVLYDAEGDPFRFPDEIELPVGSVLEILAFTDRTDLPSLGGTALEVISATLTEIPSPAISDADGNGIDDAWELFFFDGAADPFADEDGDGYNNFQESLEQTHPILASSAPSVAALPNRPPPMKITKMGAFLKFELKFPSIYSDRVALVLETSADLVVPFVQVPSTEAADDGSDLYLLNLPIPIDTRHFYRFRLVPR